MDALSDQIETITELLCELTRRCTMKDEAFASSFNLNPAEIRLLKVFAFRTTYSVKDLRQAMGLTPGRITHIVSSLEERKLVKRTSDPADNRNILVHLTGRAAPLIRNIKKNYLRMHTDLLGSMNDKELKAIRETLETLVALSKKPNQPANG